MKLYFSAEVPLALITVTVTDSAGNIVDRFVALDVFGNPGYHLQVQDSVNLTCENTRGDEVITLFTPVDVPLDGDQFTSTNVSAETFTNGTYRCDVNTPSNLECGPDIDRVVLVVVGELIDIMFHLFLIV